LGFPTGWSFTTHKETSGAINHEPAASFLALLPGIEEEEAPTSTTLSHVNLAPSTAERENPFGGKVHVA
jgi:hypothetical protein